MPKRREDVLSKQLRDLRKEPYMSEMETQLGDGETGTCHFCGQTFPTQEDLSKHLMDEHADEGLPEGLGDSREASSA